MDKEYKHFLEFLFSQYIKPNISTQRQEMSFGAPYVNEALHYLGGFKDSRRWSASFLLQFAHDSCKSDEEIESTFQIAKLYDMASVIGRDLNLHNAFAEQLGFFNMWDDYHEEIIRGIQVQYFPKGEAKFLQGLGFSNLKTELAGLIYSSKKRIKVQNSNKQEKIRSRLKKLEAELEQLGKPDGDDEKPKITRRWCKGVAKIGKGIAISLLDILIGCDILPPHGFFKIKEASTIVSIATGIESILEGIGELRGE